MNRAENHRNSSEAEREERIEDAFLTRIIDGGLSLSHLGQSRSIMTCFLPER